MVGLVLMTDRLTIWVNNLSIGVTSCHLKITYGHQTNSSDINKNNHPKTKYVKSLLLELNVSSKSYFEEFAKKTRTLVI